MIETVEKTRRRAGWSLSRILALLSLTRSRYYAWRERGAAGNLEDARSKPNRLDALLAEEIEAVKAYALAHPRDGCRRLAWMMVDEDVAYVSPSSVYRVLDEADLLYRWKRSETGSGKVLPPPKAPHERWHTDLMYLWVGGRWYFLVSVLDSYSRYIVHWELLLSMRADETRDVVERALLKYPGVRPQIVSDNGSQFTSREFRKLVKMLAREHIFIRRRHPESNGRIERYQRSVREALSEVELGDYYSAESAIARWVKYYNSERLHAGLKYLRPVDYFAGDPEARLAERRVKLERARKYRREMNAMSKAPSRPPEGKAPAWDARTRLSDDADAVLVRTTEMQKAEPPGLATQPLSCISDEVAGRLPAGAHDSRFRPGMERP